MKTFLILFLISIVLCDKRIYIGDMENPPLPPHVYIEDGVEYVDPSKRNDTVKVALNQAVSKFSQKLFLV